MGEPAPIIHSLSEGGIVAESSPLPSPEARVAPSTDAKAFNTIKSSLVPFACWRAGDLRFDFASSFVRPEIAVEVGALKTLIDKHTLTDAQGKAGQKPALTVFGHADPTGDDNFNKALSGRRAQAIYGMLTRRTDLWEELFNNSADKWGKKALATMLDTVSPTEEPEREKQLNKLQQSAGERKTLYKSYMDFICGSDVFRLEADDLTRLRDLGVVTAPRLTVLLSQEFGTESDFLDAVRKGAVAGEPAQDEAALAREAEKRKPFVVAAADFLAGGKDHGGKGDFQGCGEFNPVFLQSQADIDAFNQAPASSPDRVALQVERDDANEPDRRVLIFLFRPGLRISPDVWPCPRAKEGTEGCRKRFFSDGDKRRNTRLPDAPRKFDDTKDTFACRFYQRMTDKSPCERTLKSYQLKLFDQKARPLPFAPFVAVHASPRPPEAGRADKDAVLTLLDLVVPSTLVIRWSRPQSTDSETSPKPSPTGSFEFELAVRVEIPDEDNDDTKVALDRLRNMGYVAGPRQQDNIADFQRDYRSKLPANTLKTQLGKLDPPTIKVLRDFYNSGDLLLKSNGETPRKK